MPTAGSARKITRVANCVDYRSLCYNGMRKIPLRLTAIE